MASAVVCRAVLMFELEGMRNALEDPHPNESYALVGSTSTAVSSSHNIQRAP